MEDLPRVLALAAPIVDVDGVRLVVLSLELWSDKVYVHLAGLPNEVTRQAMQNYESAFAAWELARGAGGDSEPPIGPGVRLLHTVEVQLADDRGTDYQLTSSSAGGSGTEWRGIWTYTGRPSISATSVEIRLTRRNETIGRVEVPLA